MQNRTAHLGLPDPSRACANVFFFFCSFNGCSLSRVWRYRHLITSVNSDRLLTVNLTPKVVAVASGASPQSKIPLVLLFSHCQYIKKQNRWLSFYHASFRFSLSVMTTIYDILYSVAFMWHYFILCYCYSTARCYLLFIRLSHYVGKWELIFVFFFIFILTLYLQIASFTILEQLTYKKYTNYGS